MGGRERERSPKNKEVSAHRPKNDSNRYLNYIPLKNNNIFNDKITTKIEKMKNLCFSHLSMEVKFSRIIYEDAQKNTQQW